MTAVMLLGENAYGMTIHERVEELRPRTVVSIGAVYTTLDRLEKKGLVRSWYSDPTPERGGRSKRFFAVEGCGRAGLAGVAHAGGGHGFCARLRGRRGVTIPYNSWPWVGSTRRTIGFIVFAIIIVQQSLLPTVREALKLTHWPVTAVIHIAGHLGTAGLVIMMAYWLTISRFGDLSISTESVRVLATNWVEKSKHGSVD